MKIAIICSNHKHPIYPVIKSWITKQCVHHDIKLVSHTKELELFDGDILFLISCNEIVQKDVRQRYRACLVIHASDLPLGRGWSPLVWQILEGRKTITVTLLEAEDSVDTGAIWKKTQIHFEGHELSD